MIILFLCFIFLSLVNFTYCAKKKEVSVPSNSEQKPASTSAVQSVSKVASKKSKKQQKTAKSHKSAETEDDVQFNINIKKEEKVEDDFDDDEENPLAKLEVKKKAPTAVPSATAHTPQEKTIEKPEKGDKPEKQGEQFVLAANEKMIGMSCYQFDIKGKGVGAKKSAHKGNTPKNKNYNEYMHDRSKEISVRSNKNKEGIHPNGGTPLNRALSERRVPNANNTADPSGKAGDKRDKKSCGSADRTQDSAENAAKTVVPGTIAMPPVVSTYGKGPQQSVMMKWPPPQTRGAGRKKK